MSALVDLHVHLLPGLDDGPATLAESLEHARRMSRAGVGEAVVTPHVTHPCFEVETAEIAERTAALQHALDLAGVGLRLRPGGELHAGGAAALGPGELDRVAQGPPGRRWVLLEAPFAGLDASFVDTAAGLRGLGFGVLIAHPERSSGLLADGLGHLARAVAEGAGVQVNACSLAGRHGLEARAAARYLLCRGLATVIASDGHGERRPHTLRSGFDGALAAGLSPARALALTMTGPALLLARGMVHPIVTLRSPEGHEPPARGGLAGGHEPTHSPAGGAERRRPLAPGHGRHRPGR